VSYRLLRPLLFRLPPELAHQLAVRVLAPLEAVLERRTPAPAKTDPVLVQELWGLTFPNPVGLAAGFDKNGVLPHVWAALGFGFAELGTVTAHAQPGNPPPRLFRLTDQHALINRLGFNNAGAEAVARTLAARLRRRPPIPLGINLGKSRITPVEDAIADYRRSVAALFDCADYLVVNVSSPNTPGLRDLQSAAQLAPLLDAVQQENHRLAAQRGGAPRPLLVKIAPDLDADALRSIVEVALAAGAAGLIATNTTVDRSALPASHPLAREAGGLSGAPLRARATAVIRALHRLTSGRLPIVGVGGVFSADDAYEKIRAGASLIQVYTGFVYEGPATARRICRGLCERLTRDGYPNLRPAVGVDAGLGRERVRQ
jgi:dihydroorotate dehydrogenase